MKILIPQKRTPQGASPNGAQEYASKRNLTRPASIGQCAAAGISAIIEKYPDGRRQELRRWAAGLLALPDIRGR